MPLCAGQAAADLSDLARDWYSSQLAAAAEPSLYTGLQAPQPEGNATLRFTWLRSFHHPVTIRIETTGPGRHRLVAKELSGQAAMNPAMSQERSTGC